jgi:hypothetical protein
MGKGGIEMSQEVEVQEYLHSYLPSLIEKRLAQKPVPDMEGTSFTMQFTIEGEKSLTYGITINDAREIKVSPGGVENPIFSISIGEDFIRPFVDLVSSFVSRKQYEALSNTKGKLELDMEMPGDWKLPVAMLFNGTDSPQLILHGQSEDILKMVTGEINAPTAFLQGKIQIEGDLAFAMSLANLFT